jgi:hypothetical protein
MKRCTALVVRACGGRRLSSSTPVAGDGLNKHSRRLTQELSQASRLTRAHVCTCWLDERIAPDALCRRERVARVWHCVYTTAVHRGCQSVAGDSPARDAGNPRRSNLLEDSLTLARALSCCAVLRRTADRACCMVAAGGFTSHVVCDGHDRGRHAQGSTAQCATLRPLLRRAVRARTRARARVPCQQAQHPAGP